MQIRHNSHKIATQSSHFVDRSGWQVENGFRGILCTTKKCALPPFRHFDLRYTRWMISTNRRTKRPLQKFAEAQLDKQKFALQASTLRWVCIQKTIWSRKCYFCDPPPPKKKKKTNFVRFSELLWTFAMAPKRSDVMQPWQSYWSSKKKIKKIKKYNARIQQWPCNIRSWPCNTLAVFFF